MHLLVSKFNIQFLNIEMGSRKEKFISELTAMGFSLENTLNALELCEYDFNSSLSYLIENSNNENPADGQNSSQESTPSNNSSYKINLNTLEPLNPEERRRIKGVPVGLKNIGNTCYFNSLIQSYFMIPSFVREIFGYPIEDNTNKKMQNLQNENGRVLEQLQRLFAHMIGTNKMYIDPTFVLNCLVNDLKNDMKMGKQNDVGEFNIVLTSKIDESIKQLEENKNAIDKPLIELFDGNSSALADMFYGKQCEIIKSNEEDGAKVKQSSQNIFGQINLNIHHEDLYSAWDSATNSKIEGFVTPKNHIANASHSIYINKLPSILLFQIQRVFYDNASSQAVKTEDKFSFPKTIYVDRFLLKNQKYTKSLKLKAENLRREIKDLELFIDSNLNYNSSSMSLQNILMSSADFVNKLSKNELSPDHIKAEEEKQKDLITTSSTLFYLIEQLKTQLEAAQDRINTLKLELESIYDTQELKKSPYLLHSILVHEGQADKGHYYSFIYDPEDQRWRKYNDIHVTDVTEAEVMASSIGGNGSSSAYCLVYLDPICLENVSQERFRTYSILGDINDDLYTRFIPEQLKYEVKYQNDRELEQLYEWRASMALNEIQELYLARQAASYDHYIKFRAQKSTPGETIQYELINFATYLKIIGAEHLSRWQILDTCVKEIDQQKRSLADIEKIDPLYIKLKKNFLKNCKEGPANLDLKESEIRALEKELNSFGKILKDAYLTTHSLKCMNKGKIIDAMKSFVYQLQLSRDESTIYQKIPRDAHKVLLLKVMSDVIKNLAARRYKEAMEFLGHVIMMVCLVLEENDPHFKQIELVVEELSQRVDEKELGPENFQKFIELRTALKTGDFVSSFDFLDQPSKLRKLVARLEMLNPYAWKDGWRQKDIAVQFAKELNELKHGKYTKWINLHNKLANHAKFVESSDFLIDSSWS
ncbi:unnamed protein product [Blepharisma stoltei]|uniref:Ubiquitin carboxyl-terminal hydrolase n=1 Tax=Blepharisma stoltei TaxID=1481888 RepID=A0AAU9JGL1_9CILI|nr:unnamed protein product [Blepharisma stoltei]